MIYMTRECEGRGNRKEKTEENKKIIIEKMDNPAKENPPESKTKEKKQEVIVEKGEPEKGKPQTMQDKKEMAIAINREKARLRYQNNKEEYLKRVHERRQKAKEEKEKHEKTAKVEENGEPQKT